MIDRHPALCLVLILLLTAPCAAGDADDVPLLERVEHGYADSNGVSIHYVSVGSGPLIVMIHGFPDYWYSWRHQMPALAESHRVVAIDMRGYNRSDKPDGVEQYDMRLLVGDVIAVIQDVGEERATIVGHDWGGAVAWTLAMARPDVVDRLIICNLPHPRGLTRELRENADQQRNSGYARAFQQEGAHESLTAEGLASWVADEESRPHYIEAFERSDFEAMLNYYKRNYPRTGASEARTDASDAAPAAEPTLVKVQAPVLMIHGLDDQALLPGALNDTWEWLERDLTLVTIPGAGHFVQHDAADLVTRTMVMWLNR